MNKVLVKMSNKEVMTLFQCFANRNIAFPEEADDEFIENVIGLEEDFKKARNRSDIVLAFATRLSPSERNTFASGFLGE